MIAFKEFKCEIEKKYIISVVVILFAFLSW